MNRVVWVDYIKALCIILMVACHYGMPHELAKIAYSFHMPALFIASGYLFKPASLFKTIGSLAIPVTLFSLITFVVCLFRREGLAISDYAFWEIRDNSGEVLFPGIWFVWALLTIRVLLWIFRAYTNWVVSNAGVISISLVIFVSLLYFGGYDGRNALYIERALPSGAFYIFGMSLRNIEKHMCQVKQGQLLDCINFIRSHSKTLGALFFLSFLPIIYLTPFNISLYGNDYTPNFCLCYIISVFITLSLILFFSKFRRNTIVELISSSTIVIFGIHATLMWHVFYVIFPGKVLFLLWTFGTMICVSLSIIVYKFLIRFSPWILGRFQNRGR